MIITKWGAISTTGTGPQFNTMSYTVPGGRTLYVTKAQIYVGVAATATTGLGMSQTNSNGGIFTINIASQTLEEDFTDPIPIATGNTLYIFSSGWAGASSIGFTFQGFLI